MYTRVLLGNLSIERCKFKTDSGFTGSHFDSLARQYLWIEGKDYLHGTGHGVGFCLNVHEGPHGISSNQRDVAFKEGMVVTNEPGYYLENEFGIRIENNLLVQKCVDNKDFYIFENLTCVPYENKLLNKKLLSDDTINFINNYHEKCRIILEPLLKEKDDKFAQDFLHRITAEIKK